MRKERDQLVEKLYQTKEVGLSDLKERLDINTSQGNFDFQDQIKKTLQLNKEDSLLDVGCGTGKHLKNYKLSIGNKGFGCDPSIDDHHVDGIEFKKAKASLLPYPDNCITKLMCNYALYYEYEWQQAISEMQRVLKPNAVALITGPALGNNEEFYGFHKSMFGDISEVDKLGLNFLDTQLIPYLKANNFKIKSECFINSVSFGSSKEFMDYYCSTSLYRMTSQNMDIAKLNTKLKAACELHFSKKDVFINKKKIRFLSILV